MNSIQFYKFPTAISILLLGPKSDGRFEILDAKVFYRSDAINSIISTSGTIDGEYEKHILLISAAPSIVDPEEVEAAIILDRENNMLVDVSAELEEVYLEDG